ncbi:MAG: hypothetical protein IJ785_01775 [Bacteroidales bacterium]|nr:hypothetical protein [Bacteroidales bacterium]
MGKSLHAHVADMQRAASPRSMAVRHPSAADCSPSKGASTPHSAIVGNLSAAAPAG